MSKKAAQKVTMKDEFFRSCVDQAVDMGYRRFDLMPCTGDIFMDRGIFSRLQHLESTAAVEGYAFHTNFTIPRARDIKRLFDLRKLSGFAISIYGHDAKTFVDITQSTEKVYRRLVYNLETLLAEIGRHKIPVNFFTLHPGVASLRGRDTEIARLLDRARTAGITVKVQTGVYNNWGGFVTNEDVSGLLIEIVGPNLIDKKGACVRLFTTVQIMATGIVNGCACRDANATLRLGDLNDTSLRDLISSRNPRYMALIEQQQKGEFHPVCQSCDLYASIYRNSSTYRKNGVELESIEAFKNRIR